MMKIAIIAAMQEELQPFRDNFGQTNTIIQRGKTKIERVNDAIWLVESGIGKANAAATTAWLCQYYSPNLIINTGSTGSFVEHIALGDVILSNRFIYSDVDATGFGYHWGQVPQMPADYPVKASWISHVQELFLDRKKSYTLHTGTIATSDSFMSNIESVQRIQQLLPNIYASDMESAAIAQIAHSYQIDVLNIRGVSDYVGQHAPELFKQSLTLAARNAFDAVMTLVENQM